METKKFTSEEFKVSGDQVVAKVKELVHEGNIRRIVIKNDEGKKLLELPLSWSLIGLLLFPGWVILGTIAALAVKLTISVEKEGEKPE